ncbi:hypothetical protein [Streptomyces chartreusis]|uniref:hypothetical protein n=1 Tax=Streptomyces chartreusis TaxID=1969 RepID=UPI0036A2C4A6
MGTTVVEERGERPGRGAAVIVDGSRRRRGVRHRPRGNPSDQDRRTHAVAG